MHKFEIASESLAKQRKEKGKVQAGATAKHHAQTRKETKLVWLQRKGDSRCTNIRNLDANTSMWMCSCSLLITFHYCKNKTQFVNCDQDAAITWYSDLVERSPYWPQSSRRCGYVLQWVSVEQCIPGGSPTRRSRAAQRPVKKRRRPRSRRDTSTEMWGTAEMESSCGKWTPRGTFPNHLSNQKSF